MKRHFAIGITVCFIVWLSACSTAYKAQPVSFKAPAASSHSISVSGAQFAAKAFDSKEEAKKAFGFDIIGAGMLPVQVVIDNQGPHTFEINGQQTFLEDQKGNMWQLLTTRVAYERATKYSKSGEIAKESAYKGMLGAAAGSIIGAAVGIVVGEDIGKSVGKGAAAGAAAGAVIGGATGYTSDKARRSITRDLQEKSLENKAIAPKSLAHGILFFPGEAVTARQLRLQVLEKESGQVHVLMLNF